MCITKAKRKRVGNDDSSDEHDSDGQHSDESGSGEVMSIDEAALHTLWDIEDAKNILLAVSKKRGLSVFAVIRSTWGKGLEVQKAVDAHIEGMYESGYAEPTRGGGGIFDMLEGTRQLARLLLEAKVFDAAFFFAHAPAAMIRRCEADDADDEEEVVEWAKQLDAIMAGAVNGWRTQSGDGKAQKKDAATLVELLAKGERAKGYGQEKWYPDTLKALRAWAK